MTASWPKEKFKNVAQVVTGSTPSTQKSEYFGGDIPFVTPVELDTQDPVVTAKTTLTELGADEARLLPAESVMVSCIGTLGKIGFAGREVVTNQQINSLVFDKKKVFPRYGYHFCRTLRPYMEHIAPSTTLPIVNKGRFSDFEIPLPSLDEQRRIAEVLDKADALRQKRRLALQKLDTLLQSVFLEMFGDPASNPKGLPKEPIGSFAKIITGNTPSRAISFFYGELLEWIKSDNINTPSHFLTAAVERLSDAGKKVARIAPIGSVLVTCIAGSPDCIGNAAIANREVAFNQQINAIIPNSDFDFRYVYVHCLVGKKLIQAASTNSMKGMVSKSSFERIDFLRPTQDDQARFALFFDLIIDAATKKSRSFAHSESLFRSIQNRAFAGKLFKTTAVHHG